MADPYGRHLRRVIDHVAALPASERRAVTLPTWWRIVPKRKARDVYVKRFDSYEEAEQALNLMRRRHTHKVVAYNAVGKRLR